METSKKSLIKRYAPHVPYLGVNVWVDVRGKHQAPNSETCAARPRKAISSSTKRNWPTVTIDELWDWVFRTTRLCQWSPASSAANFCLRSPIGTRHRLRSSMRWTQNVRNRSATRDNEVDDDTRNDGRRTLHKKRAVNQRRWRR